MTRTILTTLVSAFIISAPVFAADPISASSGTDVVATVNPAPATATIAPASIAAAASAEAASSVLATPAPAPVGYDWWRAQNRRPAALIAMYAGTVILQGYDAYSTMQALKLGGREANPFMKTATSNPAAFLGVKAAVTAASIISAEQMWKKHNRTGAIITMAVTNGFMAWVAMHNAGVVSGLQH